jgi:hypothetical protein
VVLSEYSLTVDTLVSEGYIRKRLLVPHFIPHKIQYNTIQYNTT